jgi:hypothetical protein
MLRCFFCFVGLASIAAQRQESHYYPVSPFYRVLTDIVRERGGTRPTIVACRELVVFLRELAFRAAGSFSRIVWKCHIDAFQAALPD